MPLLEELPETEAVSAGGLTVTRATTDEGFDALKDEWNRLAGDVPFRRWEWLEAWWGQFRGSQDELCLLSVRDGAQQLVGLAPWFIEHSTMDGSVVKFLGSGHVCSDYLTILAVDGRSEEIALRVADWLVDEADFAWDAIELDGVAADDAAVLAFSDRLQSRNHNVHAIDGLSCWRIDFPADWDAYLKSLSKSRRERVRQLQRRQFDTGRAVVHRAKTNEDFQRGFQILIDLHQQRRESLGERGCFSDPAFASFLRTAATRFLELGRLRLQWIELEGRPVAAQIDIGGGGTSFHYQSGIDPSIPNERPGWLGTAAALKTALEEGYTRFDFLRGDESYKSHWRAEPVVTIDVRIAGVAVSSRLRHEMWTIQRRLKNWVKSRFFATAKS